METLATRGRLAGSHATIAWTPAHASSTPIAAPPRDSETASTSRPRTIAPREAPSAARTAISGRLTVARASMRFATFAHAMSSTSPTAPSSISIQVRTAPTRCSWSVTTRTRIPLLQSGYSASSASATWFIRPDACAIDTPGFSRPMTVRPKLRLSRRTRSSSRNAGGT